MVDRVYKSQVPELRKALEDLHKRVSKLSSKTDWANLRVAPVLEHAQRLEQLLKSRKYSRDFLHLTKGVQLFHSDLVYLRENVRGIEKILETEQPREDRRRKRS